MCYHTKLNAKLQDIEKIFDAQFIDPDAYSPMEEINAFDFKKTPVIFAFAGIYSSWRHPPNKELVYSYSILTTEANELMSKIHNNKKRMPVILREKDRKSWLSGFLAVLDARARLVI